MAAGQSLNAYIRARLFKSKRGVRKAPVQDSKALAQALSILGQSDIQTRLSALLLALETERLTASPETERDIRETCATVREMRDALVTALGLKV